MSDELDFSKPEELQTRDGRAVRIYATDHAGKYSVNGAVKNNSGWCCASWMANGTFGGDGIHRPTDLIRKPRRVTGWVNVYKRGDGILHLGQDVHDSQDLAKMISAGRAQGQIYIDAEIQT